jgi:hypothetical protein
MDVNYILLLVKNEAIEMEKSKKEIFACISVWKRLANSNPVVRMVYIVGHEFFENYSCGQCGIKNDDEYGFPMEILNQQFFSQFLCHKTPLTYPP